MGVNVRINITFPPLNKVTPVTNEVCRTTKGINEICRSSVITAVYFTVLTGANTSVSK